MEFFHKVTTYPFMHTRRMWYGVSSVAIIASIVLLFWHGLNLGIDFTGGVVLEFAYPQTADLEKTRATLEQAGFDARAGAELRRRHAASWCGCCRRRTRTSTRSARP